MAVLMRMRHAILIQVQRTGATISPTGSIGAHLLFPDHAEG